MGEGVVPGQQSRSGQCSVVMLSRVHATISREQLLEPGDRVLVAISGGPDSTALLHVLLHLQARLQVTLEAATVDHGLRPASRVEAGDVAAVCAALGVACQTIEIDLPASRRPGESIQTAARRLRLAALEQVALRRGCARIALGHSADDQAETILFRIVRGTGPRGLSGIPYRRGPFVRPLLDVRRREVLAFLRRRRLSFLEDPSNADPRFARSRVRHRWLPYLAEENPRIVEALLGLARQVRAQETSRSRESRADLAPAWATDPRVSRGAREVIARLAARPGGTRWVSIQGAVAEIRYGEVHFHARPAALAHEPDLAPGLIAVRGPGSYVWTTAGGAGKPVRVALRLAERAEGAAPAGATFDPDLLGQGLVLRELQPGDRMRPRGGRGSRKLQDLLVDAKIPRAQRRGLPALVAAGGTGPILYVPGLRPSEEGRPRPDGTRWLEVKVETGYG